MSTLFPHVPKCRRPQIPLLPADEVLSCSGMDLPFQELIVPGGVDSLTGP